MRLGIDYGTVVTRAVLAWPDGRYTQMLVDGTAQLPSAVYVDTDAALWAGLAAQRRAETDPAGLVPHPKRHIAAGTVAVRGQPVQVVDLIAATLRRVGEQATQVAGQPVSDVTLTVPAGWGPARRTVLRRAATRAGLAQPHLLEAPVAVAGHLQSAGITIPVGAAILLCDFGAGRFEATVLARTSGGFEVVSTIDTPDAAGLALDAVLAGHVATITATLTPTLTPAPADAADGGASGRPDRVDGGLGAVHAAIQALATNPAVAVPAGSGPPVVVDRPTLHALTRPLLAHAAHTATAAVTAADLTIDALAGVYCHGAGTPPAIVLDALTETLPTATVIADPETAAVLGAVHAHGHPSAAPPPPTPPGRPGIRHYTAVAVPALASLLLLVQATRTALEIPYPGSSDRIMLVKADWGEYALAGLLALHAALGAAVLAAATLTRSLHKADPATPPQTHRLLARFLPAAAVAGVSIAALYAAIGALWHGVPNGPFLDAALLATIPTATIATAIALLATRHPHPPATTWLDWLTIPPLASTLAATGIYLIQHSHTATTADPLGLHVTGAYLGAAVYAVAAALALPIPLGYQILATPLLATAATILTIGHATSALATLYIATTTARLLTRATQLALSPTTTANRTKPT